MQSQLSIPLQPSPSGLVLQSISNMSSYNHDLPFCIESLSNTQSESKPVVKVTPTINSSSVADWLRGDKYKVESLLNDPSLIKMRDTYLRRIKVAENEDNYKDIQAITSEIFTVFTMHQNNMLNVIL